MNRPDFTLYKIGGGYWQYPRSYISPRYFNGRVSWYSCCETGLRPQLCWTSWNRIKIVGGSALIRGRGLEIDLKHLYYDYKPQQINSSMGFRVIHNP